MDNKVISHKKEGVLARLYQDVFGSEAKMDKLPGAGSDRIYWRMRSSDGPDVMGTYGPDRVENECFVALSRVFKEAGVNTPSIYKADLEEGVYIQEDLGREDLLSLLKSENRMELSMRALKELVKIQTVDKDKWGECVIHQPFSRRLVMWDLNYFKYCFLKPAGILFNEEELENDFEKLSADLAEGQPELKGFMYRDFQSRNIMIKDGTPWLIDFQGGREGPVIYDAVSFTGQVKAGFTKEEQDILMEYYIKEYSSASGCSEEKLRASVKPMRLFRTLQVLGAYGFRGLVEKKAHFIESLPGALLNLNGLIEEGVLDSYPELKEVAERCVASHFADTDDEGRLKVKVFSFSYKKGYPEDLSGNGGGFMFDCRGMHNPGRYDEYKPLTGLDEPVRVFLEERGEVQKFVEKAIDIVSPSIETYLRRGFRNLQVGFGCTGGRHRSVYCAERFGEKIKQQFPEAEVILIHREQGIERKVQNNV
ncbi:MAG: phosphotransferase [Bacteroides sp.]|nr:phosphotransferase [Bacteroides sp.]